jgi:hypothetical protein
MKMKQKSKLARWSRLKWATPEEAAAKRAELIAKGVIKPEVRMSDWQQAENEASND